jgi:N-carbamoyl-L-amino-acid hydrolase
MNASAVTVEEAATEPSICLDRLKKDILGLSQIGRNPADRGIYRMAFTEADMEGKRWLDERMREGGFDVQWDGATNLIARHHGHEANKPSILIGSHIDTVPAAGPLDGTLGVCVGLECLRIIREENIATKRPIELIAFADEEGRFGGMLGSESFVGRFDLDRLETAEDMDGIKLTDAMRRLDLDPHGVLEAARDRSTVHSYLELHIEQGPVLDEHNEQAGIVEAITGLFRWSCRLTGHANHAGTTPMAMRKDAFMGLADFAHELPRILDENGNAHSRATIGKAQILPGAPNTVPGNVEFSLDVRDVDPQTLRELANACRRALSAIARRRDLMFDFEVVSEIEPVICDENLVKSLVANAKGRGYRHRVMPSGAAHDAQMVANLCPVGMIFAPSIGGKSHSPAEWTDWHDIEACANLTLGALIDAANA